MLWEQQRKESQMDHGPLRMVADQVQGGLSAALLNGGGQDVTFWRRQRGLTPWRWG
jgi:hypothetical protein